MLYITKNTQTIIVPKFRLESPTHLVLTNQVTKVSYKFVSVDSTPFSPTHYTFNVKDLHTEGENPLFLDSLDNGQYNYVIYHNSLVLASGIVQLGDYKTADNQYNLDLEIKQYNG